MTRASGLWFGSPGARSLTASSELACGSEISGSSAVAPGPVLLVPLVEHLVLRREDQEPRLVRRRRGEPRHRLLRVLDVLPPRQGRIVPRRRRLDLQQVETAGDFSLRRRRAGRGFEREFRVERRGDDETRDEADGESAAEGDGAAQGAGGALLQPQHDLPSRSPGEGHGEEAERQDAEEHHDRPEAEARDRPARKPRVVGDQRRAEHTADQEDRGQPARRRPDVAPATGTGPHGGDEALARLPPLLVVPPEERHALLGGRNHVRDDHQDEEHAGGQGQRHGVGRRLAHHVGRLGKADQAEELGLERERVAKHDHGHQDRHGPGETQRAPVAHGAEEVVADDQGQGEDHDRGRRVERHDQ